MSPIPPNKNESFDGSKNGVGEENVNVSEEVTTNTEEAAADGWDPNYYAVGYNYRQLNQSEPVNADAKESESDEESELPELDPDVEFEILAETRSTNKIKKVCCAFRDTVKFRINSFQFTSISIHFNSFNT